MRRVLMVVAIAAVSGCSGTRGGGVASSIPAGDAPALHSSLPKPGTLFAAIFAGALPGSVVISAPPYTGHGATDPIRGPVNVALTKSGSLVVAGTGDSAVLSIVKPPYTGQPSTIASVFWAGGMALDQSDDIFLAQGIAPRSKITYFKEYLAPDYTQSVRFATSKQRFITAVTALPNNLLAVGSVRNGPNDTSLPGTLTIYSPPYTKAPTRISALTYVSAMTVVPKGLIVVVCSQCFTQSGGAYLALVAPPFTSVTKILAKLPNVTAPAITSTAAGDIFVKQDTLIYRYAPPYSKGQKLSNSSLALETMATAPKGDLFFGARNSNGFSFTIDKLSAPYTGQPQVLFTVFGPPAQMTVSK
jgi:hypothetical protein